MAKSKMTTCKHCGAEIAASAIEVRYADLVEE